MSIDLSVDKSKIVWGNTAVATIKGTVNKDGVSASSWKYRWVDENGVSVTPTNVTVSDVADMSLWANSDLAGKTLTLYVYDVSVTNQTLYDINTGITVTVEKQDLKDVANIVGVEDLKYNGFCTVSKYLWCKIKWCYSVNNRRTLLHPYFYKWN